MSPKPITTNTLFYGDNLPILREYIAGESIDLIYLDPPFNSNRSYNVLFKDESGHEAESQVRAFDDTWHWGPTPAATYQELITHAPERVGRVLEAFQQLIGSTSQMMAYLVMMTARLVELHRVLKPTGSLYLHCDPTASHYLKIVLDTIFGPDQFRSEVVWKRTHAHGSSLKYGPVHDIIFFYSKTNQYEWTGLLESHDDKYLADHFTHVDSESGRRFQPISLTGAGVRHGESGKPWRDIDPTKVGRHWALPGDIIEKLGIQGESAQEKLEALDAAGMIYWPQKSGGTPRLKWYADQLQGMAIPDIWTDINPLSAQTKERLGYPTQKPLALLERIIQASSNPGDVVLDPFCGCGTAIVAAQKLGRRWIGIDVTHLAITLQKYRLAAMFPGIQFQVIGEPQDVGAARQLARDDRYQFQWWTLSLVRARPIGDGVGATLGGRPSGKKGSDRGMDGVIAFLDDAAGKPKRALVQVKSGHVKSADLRDLRGVVEREGAALGLFLTLESPTSDMQTEALAAGFYHSPGWNKDYPRIQILTIEDLLRGTEAKLPPTEGTFKQVPRVQEEAKQGALGL